MSTRSRLRVKVVLAITILLGFLALNAFFRFLDLLGIESVFLRLITEGKSIFTSWIPAIPLITINLRGGYCFGIYTGELVDLVFIFQAFGLLNFLVYRVGRHIYFSMEEAVNAKQTFLIAWDVNIHDFSTTNVKLDFIVLNKHGIPACMSIPGNVARNLACGRVSPPWDRDPQPGAIGTAFQSETMQSPRIFHRRVEARLKIENSKRGEGGTMDQKVAGRFISFLESITPYLRRWGATYQGKQGRCRTAASASRIVACGWRAHDLLIFLPCFTKAYRNKQILRHEHGELQ